ncbi:translation initiation factor IF-2 [candidate division WWE3 bacterium CG_4_9_14_0_2_um_filter_35_11]|uniref:Translation initiation factor IF-2 n=1 Tax=candidate division WWE3 bacterium CG_4_9_14_0_2_um_filter_35_11 TaxID=1975077 RepID=A0A2M8EL61_UNCKA|nr:MAG: translation initiation factor IF-2 [candidate division WWE3 bacterium CG10_big_fil_rev_8_21_14_0_10_35_32]PJC23469.1 MAG: translation initiation factor IF-2 [candidate division WWE3 bacterium CG_4_9_14_0_2_um_filter_35_11]
MKTAKTKKSKNPEIKHLRPPIVTLMGHVDHGKTSILDAIRESHLTKKESGGITQHIGAYTVEKSGKKITFIDTPGHEAFTKMRARGGAAADIVILVVAADDGVMPQTKEAIMHATAAAVPIIVAINKVDIPGVDIMRVKKQLADNGILVEGFGGDIVAVSVSATKKTGISELLDVINLIAEMQESSLTSNVSDPLKVLAIESRHDPRSGIIVSGIVKSGSLKLRDEVCTKDVSGKVKAIIDSSGKRISVASPGDAVEILGFTDTPQSGDVITTPENLENLSKEESTEVEVKSSDEVSPVSETPLVPTRSLKSLNLVIKADTAGTLEAIIASINKIWVEDAIANIMFAGTGEVKESDILLASTGKAVVVAFKVGVPPSISKAAEAQKVIIREHEIIYKLLEEIEGALQGVVEIEEAKVKGKGFVIEKFVLPKSSTVVAGVLIEAGKFKTNSRIGVYRGESETPVYVARIKSMHIGPNEVQIANKGDEVGLIFKPETTDINLDDRIVAL